MVHKLERQLCEYEIIAQSAAHTNEAIVSSSSFKKREMIKYKKKCVFLHNSRKFGYLITISSTLFVLNYCCSHISPFIFLAKLHDNYNERNNKTICCKLISQCSYPVTIMCSISIEIF